MPETLLTDETIINAVQNEWGKDFTLGTGDQQRKFQIKDLPYFDYVEFMNLARPVIKIAANTLDLGNEGGEIKVDFNMAAIDFEEIVKVCEKELPRMGMLICRQTDPRIKAEEVAILAHRPQRLVELVLMQIMHNNMIEEFGSFFQRLTAMVTAMMPDLARVTAPSEATLTTDETPSS